MAFVPVGTVTHSAETGETTEILATPAETGDRYRVHITLAPGSDSERHVHPALTEAFVVRSGQVSVRLGRRVSILRSGDSSRASAGTVHAIWNHGTEPAGVDVDIIFDAGGPRPSADLVRFGAAYERMVEGHRRPGPLEMAVLMDQYAEAFALPLPVMPQRFVIRALAALGRARGHAAL